MATLRCLHRITASLVLTTVPAQVFVVDAANGPGTNFTDLPTAVAAVPDGAVLDVRPGSYGGFTIVGKGLAILGGPGVDVLDAIEIRSTSAAQAVTVSGLRWPTAHIPTWSRDLLVLRDLVGPTLVELIDQPANLGCHPGLMTLCFRPRGVNAANCRQLHLRSAVVGCSVALSNCNTVIEGCRISGEDYLPPGAGYDHARTGLTVISGTTQVCGNSTVAGGNGQFYNPQQVLLDGPAIAGGFGDLRLLDGSYLAGNGSGSTTLDIVFSATRLRMAPGITATSAFTPTVLPMPSLRATSAPPGGTLAATAASQPGDLAVLALGFPSAPVATGLADTAWLAPSPVSLVAVGVVAANGSFVGQFALPNQPWLRGTRLVWQAVAAGPTTGLQLSNPAGVVVL